MMATDETVKITRTVERWNKLHAEKTALRIREIQIHKEQAVHEYWLGKLGIIIRRCGAPGCPEEATSGDTTHDIPPGWEMRNTLSDRGPESKVIMGTFCPNHLARKA